MPGGTRLLIIALDGATFDIINPLIQSGNCPHLKHLIETGCAAPLRSTNPPFTWPAWSSFMTGMNAGKHGVFDFTRPVLGSYDVRYISALDRSGETIWMALSHTKNRVAVLGFPTTFPPEPVNGVMIAGFDAPVTTSINRSFIYPPEIYDQILRTVGPYLLSGLQEIRKGYNWHRKMTDRLKRTAKRKFEIAHYLLNKESWDVFAVLFGETDTVAHHFWAHHDPNSPRHISELASQYGDVLNQTYIQIDQYIGNLMNACPKNTPTIIISDHGSGGANDTIIQLNLWLQQQGYLKLKSGRTLLNTTRSAALKWLPATIQQTLFRTAQRRWVSSFASHTRRNMCIWKETKAFSDEMNYFPSIWINRLDREPEGCVPQSEYESFRSQLIRDLANWKNPFSGERIFQAIYRREDLYHGDNSCFAPDLILTPALDKQGYSSTLLPSNPHEHPQPVYRLPQNKLLGAKGEGMNGNHRDHGILITHGTPFDPLEQFNHPSLLDLAPTILHLLDEKIPENMDGRILKEVMVPRLRNKKPLYRPPRAAHFFNHDKPNMNHLHRRLQALGYLPDNHDKAADS